MSGMTLKISRNLDGNIGIIAYGNNQPEDAIEKLALYNTEKRAIEVLDEICKAYQYCNEWAVCGIGVTKPEFVFEMPEE